MRVDLVSKWGEIGIGSPRDRFPVESYFAERLDRFDGIYFAPMVIPHRDDVEYNTQVSYLIDAYDALPSRPDSAFDSTWRAFESLTKRGAPGIPSVSGNITDSLLSLAKRNSGIAAMADLLTSKIPSQSCEYAFKRIVEGKSPTSIDHSAYRRIEKEVAGRPEIAPLVSAIKEKYHSSSGGSGTSRRGAMLLRKALRGETVEIAGIKFELGRHSRSHFLLSGLLYTARNERMHGESFSPFISSAATMKTYVHSHYLFLCCYAVIHELWSQSRLLEIESHPLVQNVTKNINAAQELYGQHWNK